MKKVIILVVLILFASINLCFAQSGMQVIANKNIIEKDEEVEISINLNNVEVVAFTLEIYWDATKLEYVKGPENSNKVNDRIVYTWVNEDAQNINEINIGNFIFKGIENGKVKIVVTGEFYNSAGANVDIEDTDIELQIGKIEEKVIKEESSIHASDDNTNLKILRINHEGISPGFSSDIKEYYFIANDKIDGLEVTVVPENEAANVTITGNSNFKFGSNIINIEVQSKDKTKKEVYKIYVTKTKNVDLANANLENLAIRQATLNPEFDYNVTKYYVEVANDIDKLDILAVPQKQNATVSIVGNDEINIGDTKIDVVVSAQDGITIKKYEITVHRRNELEEIQSQEEQEVQVEKLSAILEETQNESQIPQDIKKENNNFMFGALAIFTIGMVITLGYIAKKRF